jgi:hypothetical protein
MMPPLKDLKNQMNLNQKEKNSNLFHQFYKKPEDYSPITSKSHLSYKKVKTKPSTSPQLLWLKLLPTYQPLLLNYPK